MQHERPVEFFHGSLFARDSARGWAGGESALRSSAASQRFLKKAYMRYQSELSEPAAARVVRLAEAVYRSSPRRQPSLVVLLSV